MIELKRKNCPTGKRNRPAKALRFPGLLAPGAILSALVILCMKDRRAGDFYAMHIYPAVSSVLSLVASPFGFSLQSVFIALFASASVLIVIKSCKGKTGVLDCLLKELTLVVWIFVWAYSGWCLNYSRSPITARVESRRAVYDSTEFRSFLADYTDRINASRVPEESLDLTKMEVEIKAFYASVPEKYGLCKPKGWQHPKRMPLRRFESAMGILGYFGPFFCESHLNPDVPATGMPYTFAHEYSHLLGVSSEAEANWWAFQCCRNSSLPAMRYSAYLSTLSAVTGNAARLLTEDEFKEWLSSLRQEVKDDFNADREFWRSVRIPALDEAQKRIYNIFLKGNNVSSGVANYSEVVCLMMSLDDLDCAIH